LLFSAPLYLAEIGPIVGNQPYIIYVICEYDVFSLQGMGFACAEWLDKTHCWEPTI
jgi:hypothetical protein